MELMRQEALQTDLFVVGGGPAGLAAAIAARQKGLSVIVADYAHPPIDKACGEGLMPDAISALSRLGVTLGLNQGVGFRGIRFTDSQVSVAAKFPRGFGLGIRRPELHELLIRRAEEAGVAILWGTRVSKLPNGAIELNGRRIESRWIIGADGQNSRTRVWMGLDCYRYQHRRYGFRQHYRVTPWTDFVEVHWGENCQIVITPVGPDDICLALNSRDARLRLGEALLQFPEVLNRLKDATVTTEERGAISSFHSVSTVYQDRFALVGDASGSVDALTGMGLGLAFQQALALAEAIEGGDLSRYQASHRRIARLPALMSWLMLSMDKHAWLRQKVLQVLAAEPHLFSKLLAVHVSALSPTAFGLGDALKLGWRLVQP